MLRKGEREGEREGGRERERESVERVSFECNVYRRKSNMGPGTNVIKLFTSVIYDVRNKLECLSLAGLSSHV
jgi:hypothetical protein